LDRKGAAGIEEIGLAIGGWAPGGTHGAVTGGTGGNTGGGMLKGGGGCCPGGYCMGYC